MNRLRFFNLSILVLCLGTLPATPAAAQKWNRYGPATRSQSSAVYDPSTDQMMVFGGQHTPTIVDYHDLWVVKNVIATSQATDTDLNWVESPVSGTLPQERFGHTAIYNSTSNRMIIFAGGTGFPGPCVNDLWMMTNANSVGGKPAWTRMSPTGMPPPIREGHTAVYDSASNKMVVFGGTDCNGHYYNDVWILSNADGTTGTPAWTQAAPLGGGPNARSQATAVYDSVHHVMTVFAGGAAAPTAYNDVWTLSNATGTTGTPTWTQLAPSGTAPTTRSGQVAVYDSADNLMTINGGRSGTGVAQNDTWILSDANGIGGTTGWTKLPTADPGPFRASHTAIYDPVSDEMVIFGGNSQLAVSFTDDHVFVLTHANGLQTGAAWTQLGPLARLHQATGYDPVTDQMMVFGGESPTAVPLNDVWSEQDVVTSGQLASVTADWVQIFPSGTPPAARFGHSGLYDSNSNRMMFFGGATTPTSCLNDLWLLDDANSADGTPDWISLTAAGTAPSARMNHTAQYDPTKNVLMVFGGNNCAAGYLQDVWVLTNANGEGGTPHWSKLNPEGTGPSARENASSIFDSVHNVLILYAGDAGAVGLSDVWALTNANGQGGTPHWKQFSPSGNPPPARTGQVTVYDSTNNRMIMFGGINSVHGKFYLSDTWVLTNANSLGGTPTWVEDTVTGTSPALFYSSGFYSPVDNNLVVFGGGSNIEPAGQDRVFILSSANGLP